MTNLTELIRESVPNQEAGNQLMGRIFEAARPESVFSSPVTQGDYMLVTAAEVTVGLGFGYGGGGGFGFTPEANTEEKPGSAETEGDGGGFGGGGGGGGGSGARPVAAIEIGPNGVRVEPIIDPTKVIIAFFTTLGAMFMMFSRMRNKAQEMSA